MVRAVGEHSDQQLENVVRNHRARGKLDAPYFLEALEELARRKGNGLVFARSLDLIRIAAAERRFLSYKDLADGSGADWSRVRYAMNRHLGDLIQYAHGKGWPMLSAIVVNQQNVATGAMEPETLKGFAEAARWLGYSVHDEKTFLEEQQRLIFAWAESQKAGISKTAAVDL